MNEQIDLGEIERLLKYLLAIELWRAGMTQGQIKKRLKISSGAVNEMLKGVSREVARGSESKE
jgi:hypothetical protein